MFEKEFDDLPPVIANSLKKQLETLLRDIVSTYRGVLKDPETKQYQAERILASIESIFTLAKNIKKDLKNS